MEDLSQAAQRLGLDPTKIVPYGEGAAKVPLSQIAERERTGTGGKLVLVTGMTPTPQGEGKTVTSIGLAMALCRRGRKAVVCLRQPSLGPVFGVKGGASGGGRATVEPMARINLGLTGDIAAIESAHNLLGAVVDNHLYHGNALGIDPGQVVWPRTVDMNDRALRRVRVELGGTHPGADRLSGFVITAASEVMAVHGLALDYTTLKERLGRIVVGRTTTGRPVSAHELKAEGAMAVLLRDALQPNLVLTQEGTPALVHGGPFANIAHGTASLASIRLGRASSDVVVVEAGFGSDLGAEKFVDIVSPIAGFEVTTAVLVASLRALRYHGGAAGTVVSQPNLELARAGLPNLAKHIETLRALNIEPIVALNRFPTDSPEEREMVRAFCADQHAGYAESTAFADGSSGTTELADKVEEALGRGGKSAPIYAPSEPLAKKVEQVVRVVYGGSGVNWDVPEEELQLANELGADRLPICIAKTQLSLSDDPKKLGRPTGFTVRVGHLEVHAGAGFTVVQMGSITTMPGLPVHPAAESIDLDPAGEILGVH